MYYRHDLDVTYPERSDEHMIALKRTREAALELRTRAYAIMQEMNGIHPGDPTYNEDQNISHYHKTM